MTHPVTEIASLVVLTIAAAVAGIIVVTPRPKPAPPPPAERVLAQCEQTPGRLCITPAPVVVIEAEKPKTDAERIDALENVVQGIAVEQKKLAETIKELTERERAK